MSVGLGSLTDAQLRGLAGMKKEQEEEQRRRYYCNNLFELAKLLGRDLLTEDFHKPMMDDMDRWHDKRRRGLVLKHNGEIWSRDYFKTTVREVECVRDYLEDPKTTITWWHAVEDKAVEAGVNVGRYFMENEELRKLRPDMMPSKRMKKWASASGFRFAANKDRAASMRMYGAGSEATGGHSKIGILDDIIGLNDIEDNLMPKKRRWYGSTVSNVIRTRGGVIRMTGTRWDLHDIYSDWLKSSKWNIRVRGCYETEGKPDWKGQPVLYTRDEIETKAEKMTRYEFSCQMMNDPLPEGDRAWNQSQCEHFCTIREASGPGRIFVLSDPAPRDAGSLSGTGEKERGDASKDWWSICVVKIVARGQRQQMILLDGVHSQDWSTGQGLDEACRLMSKWGTNLFFNESYGGLGADYSERMFERAKLANVSVYRNKKGKLPRFNDSHASGAKNHRFEALCDAAREANVLICETVPEDFLHGDGDKTGALTQARQWRALHRGRNTLRFDDDADVWSRCTDSALQEFAPKPDMTGWDPFDVEDEDGHEQQRTKYLGF